MAQNNMMGGGMVPPPASPANPTALNFQSDPNMRQQFKGFMSGLSNRPMPQPMAQPMPAPMPMYTPASNIDIFEPVQGFANGGGVTFSSGSDYSPGGGISISSATVQGDDTYGGRNDRNDRRDSSGLNDPYEAEMIQTGKSFLDSFSPFSGGDSDGPVAFGIGSRPRVDLTGRSSPVVDALSNEIGKRSNQTGYDDAPMTSRGMLTNQAQADAAMGLGGGFGASGTTQSVTGAPTASGYDDFGLNALNLLGGSDLLSFSSPYDVGEAAGQQVAQGQPSGTAPIERERTVAGRTNRVADSGFGPGEVYRAKGAGPTEQEIVDNIADASNMRTSVTLGLQEPKFGGMAPPLGTKDAVTVNSLEQLARRAGMSPGSASSQISGLGTLGAIAGKFGASNAASMYEDIVNRGYEPVYDSRGQIIQTRVPGTDILGRGSRPNTDFTDDGEGGAPIPVPAAQPSIADLVAEELARLQPAAPAPTQTTPTPVPPTPTTPTTSTPQIPLPPLARPLGFGYGQVQGVNPNLDNAANKFLSLLGGYAEGGEVEKFEKGGSVPRATEIAGQPHMLSYITPGEASVLQSLGGSGAPGPGGIPSFFYDEVGAVEGTTGNIGSGGQDQDFTMGDDDNGSTVSVSSVTDKGDNYTVSTDVANQISEQAKKDKAARDALEATNLQQQQQQTAPQNMIQTQAGPIDPASMSMGEKMSLIGEGLGNLLDVDLFSSNAPTVDTEMAARMQAAGFSPATANRAATSVGGIFDVQKTAPTPASVTDYKNYRTTADNKINMGPVDMNNNRGFGLSGIGDMFGRAVDYVSNVDVMGNKIDTSSFGGYSK